ncbi:unnamed protein product [Calypogeia fissa]
MYSLRPGSDVKEHGVAGGLLGMLEFVPAENLHLVGGKLLSRADFGVTMKRDPRSRMTHKRLLNWRATYIRVRGKPGRRCRLHISVIQEPQNLPGFLLEGIWWSQGSIRGAKIRSNH